MNDSLSSVLLEAHHVYRNYTVGGNTITALNPISLQLSAGEFLVIRGPSGSGKSTLLHLLSGMETPSGGEVFFSGKSLHHLCNKKQALIRNRYFGFVFQTPHVLYDRTVLENVILPGHYNSDKNTDNLRDQATELLVYVGIEDLARRMPSTLSGGELQRVVFARSLICDPHIIFADEPTGSLDQENSEKIIELLHDQLQRNRAVIMVTHDLQAMNYGSRQIILDKVRGTENRVEYRV